jgi:hypothetical protein
MIVNGVIKRTAIGGLLMVGLAGACAAAASAAGMAGTAGTAPVPAKRKPAARPAPLKAKPGYVVGRAVNSAGRPLPGVTAGIYGTTIAGANTRFEAETDAAGLFSQRVPEGIYGVSAYYKVRFNNKNYNFTLFPKDGTTAKKHDSAPGVVKEFVWKIAGLKPGAEAGDADTGNEALKYYGGYVYLRSKEEGFGGDRVYFPAGSTLVVTLTPRGSLIDGSTGQVKTFRRAFAKDVTSGIATHLMDIPIGLYTLQAQVLLPGGTSKALGVKNSGAFDAPFAPSVNVDFEPTSFRDMQMMQITVEP